MMRTMMMGLAAGCMLSGVALADEKPSADETTKIVAALQALGCDKYESAEKEKGKTGVHYQIDDAICKDGEFDIKLDADFKLVRKDPE